jgi:PPOX class probable FMN-dependent enzyme
VTKFNDKISTVDQLREVLPEPHEFALRKEITFIDEHCRAFIERSSFVFLATSDASGRCDVSPKGDVPGFVEVLDEHTIAIPDRPGNNRADSLTNIMENPHAGLIFLIPGAEWTLRVNGRASVVRDSEILERCAVQGKTPLLAIAIEVEEVFLHCPKCMRRSGLWEAESWAHQGDISFAEMSRDHVKLQDVPVEVVEDALEKANETLY